MLTTGQFLEQHPRDTWTVRPEQTVRDALVLMAAKNVGAVLVLDQDKLVGVFSERDYARKVALQGKASSDTHIKDVMTSNVITVETSHTIEDCMQIMTDKHIRHLPVMKGQHLLGLISIGDVVREMMAEQKNLIQQLESYIHG
jgi:CBS domain-containing protein